MSKTHYTLLKRQLWCSLHVPDGTKRNDDDEDDGESDDDEDGDDD